ncbi:MAG: hypothetical protein JXA18_08725 [Chitinispirillaceae bacterium]|nr:hypothetical protein [Chitinispirillaceae bacterium]
MIIKERACARAGLLGNPSDGYFGKTISVIVHYAVKRKELAEGFRAFLREIVGRFNKT